LATTIVMRALRWPDAFPGSDRTLQRAVGASSASELYERAERWRPWRAYAALHLWMHEEERACDAQRPATRVRPSVSFSRRVYTGKRTARVRLCEGAEAPIQPGLWGVFLTKAQRREDRTVFTDVFVRRKGRWQAVNAQENAVPPKPGR